MSWFLRPPSPPVTVVVATISPSPTSVVVVQIVGAVRAPGVYSFSPGARVSDAIDRAGGGIQDADLSPLNLAARLMDGQRVQVPRIGEGASSSNVGRVNLNRASRSELEALPGIGAATAQRIIEQRERNGPFQSLEQLRDLRLIPGSTLDRLRDLVVLN